MLGPDRIQQIGVESGCCSRRATSSATRAMHEHRQNKRERWPGMANGTSTVYTLRAEAGVGGKLVGAAAAASCSSTRGPDDTRRAMRAAAVRSCASTSTSRRIGEERTGEWASSAAA